MRPKVSRLTKLLYGSGDLGFSLTTTLIAFTVALLMIGALRPENAGKVLTMGFVFGLVSAGPLFLTFLGTRERQEFMAQEPPKLIESLRAIFKNPPFLLGLGIFLVTWIAVDIAQAILLYFIKYCVLRESQSKLITGPIPAVLLGLGILCAVFYPLSRERYNQIVKELEERRGGTSPVRP
jgi:Na+/melibiose symporter-like transporter